MARRSSGEVSTAEDSEEFLAMFWRHGAAVHAYLARRAGQQDADDLLGEVWFRAFKDRANYDQDSPDARPWLYGIARNVLRAHWRTRSQPTASTGDLLVADPWPDIDARLVASAEAEALREALGTLSEEESEVLFLVVWEEFTPAEAARSLGIPQGTARSRLHRALSVLRNEPEDLSVAVEGLNPKEA